MTEGYHEPSPDPATESPFVEVVDRFAIIPEALLYDPDMPDVAVRVYGVLLRHGQDPENCFPSYARIGNLIGRSARSVPGWIRTLEQAGWIERVPQLSRLGDWSHNAYRVYASPDHDAAERAVRARERVEARVAQRGGSAPERAMKESKGNESQQERELTLIAPDSAPPPDPLAGFDEFWTVYPRKVAKGAARKAWPKAVEAACGVEPIIEGARRYAIERDGEDPKFTAHPATWLRAERWADQTTPAPTGPLRGVDEDRSGPEGRIEL